MSKPSEKWITRFTTHSFSEYSRAIYNPLPHPHLSPSARWSWACGICVWQTVTAVLTHPIPTSTQPVLITCSITTLLIKIQCETSDQPAIDHSNGLPTSLFASKNPQSSIDANTENAKPLNTTSQPLTEGEFDHADLNLWCKETTFNSSYANLFVYWHGLLQWHWASILVSFSPFQLLILHANEVSSFLLLGSSIGDLWRPLSAPVVEKRQSTTLKGRPWLMVVWKLCMYYRKTV